MDLLRPSKPPQVFDVSTTSGRQVLGHLSTSCHIFRPLGKEFKNRSALHALQGYPKLQTQLRPELCGIPSAGWCFATCEAGLYGLPALPGAAFEP